MIYTLTFSPSIDFINSVEKFTINKVNRAIKSKFIPGGKGINVSMMLKTLDTNSISLGFKSGFTGKYLEELLNLNNINNELIEAKGLTRINIKIISNEETALNTDTLIIEASHIANLKERLVRLEDNDIFVISGNIPHNISKNIYCDLIENINKNVKVVVDAEKELLLNTLKYNPFLIKPNREELEQIFNVKINDIDSAIYYGRKLKAKGAKNVIISLDKDGAILIDQDNNEYYVKNINGKFVSSVGAGDSLIAGFIYGIENGFSPKLSLLYGVACGNATSFSETLGDKSSINKILELLMEAN